ncbi:hypothetical protein FZI93_32920, partial [Mycobacterium sp. CBMA361]|nr:hypothetical protein [Mycolicibacterium sp. CBMA 361]
IFIADKAQWFRRIFDAVGTPLVALLIAVVVGTVTLGRGAGMDRGAITKSIGFDGSHRTISTPSVSAGGGFKQVLVDTGIGTMLARWAQGVHISVLVLAWVLAVLIRLATGSATVAGERKTTSAESSSRRRVDSGRATNWCHSFTAAGIS